MFKILLFLISSCFILVPLSACDWCKKPLKIELTQSQIEHGFISKPFVETAEKGATNKETVEKEPAGKEAALTQKGVSVQEETCDVVYFKQYLGKYYPDANLMCKSLFVSMCPMALFGALEELAVLADKTLWLYFLNDKKGFDARYLCKIIGQYARINTFIDQAFYSTKTKKIIEIDAKKGMAADARSMQRVTALWAKNKKSAPYEFYAVFYDYLTVGFNSSVMSSLQTNDFTFFSEYYPMMDQLIYKLSSSSYEKYYQDAFKKSKRILTLIQNRFEEQQKRSKPAEGRNYV